LFEFVEREEAVSDEGAKAEISLSDLCVEAVERFGENWALIEAYLAERIGEMEGAQQERLFSEVHRILRFRAPDRQLTVH
jgi:hypothetical protein